MLFDTIPRGSLPARLTCIDLISRLEANVYNPQEMKHAVGVVSRHMLDPKATIPDAELKRCLAMVEQLYLP
ncbi:MAG TPA: hypothetical protein DF774_02260 [Rheinheimera sp.]|nr:hypothetical protein [Rheinheimera sp.]